MYHFFLLRQSFRASVGDQTASRDSSFPLCLSIPGPELGTDFRFAFNTKLCVYKSKLGVQMGFLTEIKAQWLN